MTLYRNVPVSTSPPVTMLQHIIVSLFQCCHGNMLCRNWLLRFTHYSVEYICKVGHCLPCILSSARQDVLIITILSFSFVACSLLVWVYVGLLHLTSTITLPIQPDVSNHVLLVFLLLLYILITPPTHWIHNQCTYSELPLWPPPMLPPFTLPLLSPTLPTL